MTLALVVLWLAGSTFFIGETHGYGASNWREYLIDLAWPIGLPYMALWGVRRRRRWFCGIIGHRWRPVTVGVQCRRCWKVREMGP